MPKNFRDLSEREILALAISLEEEDIPTYSDIAEAMRENYPGTAHVFAAMSEEENGHRYRLLELYHTKVGDHIPLIRRQDVKGFLERKSFWLLRPLGVDKVRVQVVLMGAKASAFTRLQRGIRPMHPSASSWVTWPRRNAGTKHVPKNSSRTMCRLRSKNRKTNRSGVCLCSRSYNLVSPG